MIKRIVASLTVLMLIVQFIPLNGFALDIESNNKMRGVWVATVINLDYPSQATTSPDVLKAEALAILDQAADTGFNAVFLQVRPTGDAFYNSAIFPWSQYLTGTQGVAPADNFDPLQFWIEAAHDRGIALHAWINPYRITKRRDGDPVMTTKMLSATNPARLHPEWVVSHGGGDLYYNPGLPEVRQLIVDGITEIVSNYDVDGIHFDDYFYPGTDFNDDAAYQQYGIGQSLDDWRRENVNYMVDQVNRAIKAIDPSVSFGISPFGIWANQSSLASGSATRGNQSYSAHYADSYKWVKQEMIDYIVPQIYWHIGFDIADYQVLLNWWAQLVKGTSVDLYIGQAAYRTGNSTASSPWYGNDQIVRQLALNQTMPEVKGSVFFRMGNFSARQSLQQVVKNYYQMIDSGSYYTELSINYPTNNVSTSLSKYYVSGYANPFLPLYINGQKVDYRSPKGFFGTAVSLRDGDNKFVLSQGDNQASVNIYKGWRGSSSTNPKADAIGIANAYPKKQELFNAGETIYLSCSAPIGATVSAVFNGDTVKLSPSSKSQGSYVKHTTFSAKYKLPTLPSGVNTQMLDAPVFYMDYYGTKDRHSAAGNFTIKDPNAPYFVRVANDASDTYFEANPSKGSDYILREGMTEKIVSMSNSYVKLASGRWILRSNVGYFYDLSGQTNRVKSAVYQSGDQYDTIDLTMSKDAAVYVDLSDRVLAINVADTNSLPNVSGIDSSWIQSINSDSNAGRSAYYVRFKDFANLHGYYVEKTATGARVYLKKAPQLVDSNQPLTGITILIDPGHGGEDTGAVGLLGTAFAERAINLANSLKLEEKLTALGATVHLTRRTDETVSLYSRLRMSLELKPDMFISMHADSIGPDVNLSAVRGLSIHYKQEIAKGLADAVSQSVIGNLERYNRGVKINNFYVVRGTWTPSILVEAGFVPNALEFEWMTDEANQTMLAEYISKGVVDFFRRK